MNYRNEHEILRKHKWLKKIPKTINDLWKIMEESKEIYEMFKSSRRANNKEFEAKYIKEGVVVGVIVQAKNSRELKDEKLKVTNIKGRNIHVEALSSGKRWVLKGFEFKVVK